MTALLAATDPEAGTRFTWGYVGGAVLAVVLAALLLAVLVVIHAYVMRRLDAHFERARRHPLPSDPPAIPRRLTERTTR